MPTIWVVSSLIQLALGQTLPTVTTSPASPSPVEAIANPWASLLTPQVLVPMAVALCIGLFSIVVTWRLANKAKEDLEKIHDMGRCTFDVTQEIKRRHDELTSRLAGWLDIAWKAHYRFPPEPPEAAVPTVGPPKQPTPVPTFGAIAGDVSDYVIAQGRKGFTLKVKDVKEYLQDKFPMEVSSANFATHLLYSGGTFGVKGSIDNPDSDIVVIEGYDTTDYRTP